MATKDKRKKKDKNKGKDVKKPSPVTRKRSIPNEIITGMFLYLL